MDNYIQELKSFLNNKKYMASVLLVCLLGYGFAMTQVTIGVDDLEMDRYFGSGQAMLRAGRFGHIIWNTLRTRWATAYSIEFVAVLLFIWAVISFSIVYRRVSNGQISMEACTVFSCVLISYPLINEIWEYTRTSFNVCGGYLLVALSVLLVYNFLHSAKRRYWHLLAAPVLTMWICSGYESLVQVYVFTVFSILALQVIYGPEEEKRVCRMLLQGMLYAGVLAMGLVLRMVVHRIMLAVTGLTSEVNGAAEIMWGQFPTAYLAEKLLWDFLRGYLLKSIIYFPLTEVLIAGVVFVILGIWACRKHGAVLLLPGFGMLLSLFLLSLLQGTLSPYRICQVFGSFVAFTAMLVVIWAQNRSWKRLRRIPAVICALGCVLSLYQANYLNCFLYMNHLRSVEEVNVVRDVGRTLQAEYPQEKPVVFVGEYQLSPRILEAVSVSENSGAWRRFVRAFDKCAVRFGERFYYSYFERLLPDTNVQSMLTWALDAFEQEGMQTIFSYCGYDYTLIDNYEEIYPQANRYAVEQDMPAYPQKGYIADVGDYLIVRLGPMPRNWDSH